MQETAAKPATTVDSAEARYPAGPGEMERLITAHDWASTSIGPADKWPQSLKTIVGFMLQSPIALVLLWGPDGIMIYNDGYSVFAGGRHPSLLGSKVLEGWPEAADLNRRVMDVGLAGGTLEYQDLELHLNRRGQPEPCWVDVTYSPVIDESGKPGGVMAVVVETTDRVLSEMELRASERNFRTLSSAMPNHVWTARPDGMLDWFNDQVYAFSGAERGTLDGAEWSRMVHPEDLPTTEARWSQALGTGETYETEFRLRRADGAWRWHIARAVALRDEKGEVVRWIGTNTDIEDQKEAVRALAELKDTLEQRVEERTAQLMEAEAALRQAQKMEAVGQLTGGIAHDFNNLLTGIAGSLELMQKRIAEGRLQSVDRYIDVAQASTRRAAALTQRLLAFSRRQTLDPKPIDANRLVAGMEDLIRRTVGPEVEVEVVGAGGLWLTRVDPSQLENSLLNLAINARDAMPDGGRITIETANKWFDKRAAEAREIPPGQYISLCVTDTGTGMSEEVIRRAFDPFFTTKPLGQGTGLGLSMIHGFVRQSGGQVRIYSEPGKGTTMCLYFPRYSGELEAAEHEHHEPLLEPSLGETVLVIDDEEAVRGLIAEVLGEAGYRVLQAADGPSGLNILGSTTRIDLLITDVGLPGGMNGRQVADAARVERPGLKVLFVTGYAENAVVGNGHLEPGMQIMTKPFPVAVLAARVREIIEG